MKFDPVFLSFYDTPAEAWRSFRWGWERYLKHGLDPYLFEDRGTGAYYDVIYRHGVKLAWHSVVCLGDNKTQSRRRMRAITRYWRRHAL